MSSRVSSRRSGPSAATAVAILTILLNGCGSSSTSEGSNSDRETPAAATNGRADVSAAQTNGDAPVAESHPAVPRVAAVATDDAGAIVIPAKFADIPRAPMGREVVESALAGSPGYVPASDPELDAIERGRREAPLIEGRELGPEHHSSAEALGRRIVDLVNVGDWKTLYGDVMISREEYATFCWPEFPSSRPVTGYEAGDAWQFHWQHAISGARLGVAELSKDIPLTFARVTYERGLKPFRNFFLLDGVRIHAETADGRSVVLDFADTFIERNDRWKVFIYKD